MKNITPILNNSELDTLWGNAYWDMWIDDDTRPMMPDITLWNDSNSVNLNNRPTS